MQKDFVLVSLKDKLVNLCGEIRTSKLIDSETIKLLTGDDPITVDIKYKSAITFKPIAKHIFSTNELPKFRDKTQALRRRAVFLTFEQTFAGEDCNKHLTDELLEELPGILLWALDGWKELAQVEELYETPSCLAYKERFAETLNPVLAFVNQACELSNRLPRIKRSELYGEYRNWHLNNIGKRPLSKPAFYERLRDDFPAIPEVRVQGTDYFKGIKVRKLTGIKLKIRKKKRGKKGKPKT
jgi:putative DNA primase/helicase